MSRRAIDALWYAAFLVLALGIGWAIASGNSGETGVWIGMALAVVGGPLVALLSRLARKLAVDKHSVRVELHDFRYTWLWSTIWFGGALIAAWALADQLFYTYNVETNIITLGTIGLLAAAWFARIAGRKRDYLRVDLAAGVVEYVSSEKPVAVPFAELRPFDIVKYRKPYRGRGHDFDWYRLVQPQIPNTVLADSPYPAGVERLRARLQREIDFWRDVSAVRRVLAETMEDANYRAGLSLADALRAVVDDPKSALAYLAHDPDPEIRKRSLDVLVKP